MDVAHGLLSTRELFVRLPDLLCRSEQLRVGRDDLCWNGSALAPSVFIFILTSTPLREGYDTL